MATIALVPAFNEAGRVGPTVACLRGLAVVTDVVVIDDGSTDETAAEARAAGACCLSLPRNVGKGDALNAGIALVRHRIVDGLVGVPDVLLLADADLAETAGELRILIDALDDQRVDMAIADFPAQGVTGFGLAKALAAAGLRRFTGLTLNEPLSGQRAVRWRVLPAIVPFAPNFGVEVAMTLAASDAGLNIVEIEVPLEHSATGRDLSGVVHRANQAASIVIELAAHVERRARRRRRVRSGA